MADHPTPNGADASEPRERPSWYVPIRDRKPGAPTTQELLDNMIRRRRSARARP